MKREGCKGFEMYPCFNQLEDSDFAKAINEGKELTGWICQHGEYSQLTIMEILGKRRITLTKGPFECPKLEDERERIQALTPKDEEIKTFNNFDRKRLDKPEIVEKIKGFPNSQYKTLLLIGEPGIGKTHLAAALMNQINSQVKRAVIKVTSTELYNLFFNSITIDTAEEARAKIRKMLESWYIFIDDLGDERHTDKEVFNLEFKPFIDAYKHKFIITSNLNYKSMQEKYGQKITDRLYHNAMIIPVKALNYRLKDLPGLNVQEESGGNEKGNKQRELLTIDDPRVSGKG